MHTIHFQFFLHTFLHTGCYTAKAERIDSISFRRAWRSTRVRVKWRKCVCGSEKTREKLCGPGQISCKMFSNVNCFHNKTLTKGSFQPALRGHAPYEKKISWTRRCAVQRYKMQRTTEEYKGYTTLQKPLQLFLQKKNHAGIIMPWFCPFAYSSFSEKSGNVANSHIYFCTFQRIFFNAPPHMCNQPCVLYTICIF